MNIFKKEKRYILQTYKRHPLYAVKSAGKYIWDDRGKKYLDFFSGLGVCNVGHCHVKVVAAIREQAGKLIHTSNLYYTLPQVALAEKISRCSLKGKVFFSNSGAEANECAIKLARKSGGKNKWKIISFTNSFHGRSLATLAATGQKQFHKGFEPMPAGFIHARFNDMASVAKKMDNRVCGVLIEPVQGEGGVHAADLTFLKELRYFCTRKKLQLIFDEIQCGMGRTGKLFAYQHYGVKPDILTLAKSLGGGLPIGATVTTPKVAAVFSRGDHGSTFGGNPVACSAGNTTFQLLTPSLLRNVSAMGGYCMDRLNTIRLTGKTISIVRGIGLMIGIELNKPGADIVEKCQKSGLLINCTQGNVLRLLPPLDVTQQDIDHAINILKRYL